MEDMEYGKKQVFARARGITLYEIVQRIEIGVKVIETDHPESRLLSRTLTL